MLLSFYVKDIESLLADACERSSLLHNNNTTVRRDRRRHTIADPPASHPISMVHYIIIRRVV